MFRLKIQICGKGQLSKLSFYGKTLVVDPLLDEDIFDRKSRARIWSA